MLESKFSRDMRRAMSPRIHWTRIENLAHAGVPDIHGRLGSVHVWVETKIVKNNRITVRWSQLGWLTEQMRAAGSHDSGVWYIAGAGDYVHVWTGLNLYRKAKAVERQVGLGTAREAVRKDNSGLTFNPGIPDFASSRHDPETWRKLGTLLFGSVYGVALESERAAVLK